jgi:hypothetical protein
MRARSAKARNEPGRFGPKELRRPGTTMSTNQPLKEKVGDFDGGDLDGRSGVGQERRE